MHLTPRASRDAIAGWRDGVLRARVTAPPVDGKANAALERLLAKALGVSKGTVQVAAGDTSRKKTVAIEGLDAEEARRRLTEAAST